MGIGDRLRMLAAWADAHPAQFIYVEAYSTGDGGYEGRALVQPNEFHRLAVGVPVENYVREATEYWKAEVDGVKVSANAPAPEPRRRARCPRCASDVRLIDGVLDQHDSDHGNEHDSVVGQTCVASGMDPAQVTP